MFDVVCCHAVLQWLAHPEETVEHLARFLRPEGRLWLMFYTATPRYSRGRWKGTSLCGCDPRQLQRVDRESSTSLVPVR